MAFDPGLLAPMLFGDAGKTHTYVQDAAALSLQGETLSWWQLMVRGFQKGAFFFLQNKTAFLFYDSDSNGPFPHLDLTSGKGAMGRKDCFWKNHAEDGRAAVPSPFVKQLPVTVLSS